MANQFADLIPDNQDDEASDQQLTSVNDMIEGRGNSIWRSAGLTARSLLETPALITAGAGDLLAKGLNLGIEGLSAAGEMIGDEPITYRFQPGGTQRVEQAFTTMGFPEPETPGERVGQDVQRAIIGTAAPIKTGSALSTTATSPVTRRVGATLAENPAMQGVSVTTGAGVEGAVREAGGTPGQQVAAGILGSLSPAAVTTVPQAVVRGSVRGTSPQAVRENIDTFARGGTTPSVGQATEGRVAQATESLLSRTPGSAGRMSDAAQNKSDEVAARVEQIADSLAPKATAERAGRTVTEGVTGQGGFVDRFKNTASRLYDNVDNYVNTDGPVTLGKTTSFLSERTTPVEGAENLSKLLGSQFLDDVASALNMDLSKSVTGGLPYSTVKALRSRVGEKINNLSLIDDASKADLKRLYGALSQDLSSYAGQFGPRALNATRRADNFYRAGIRRIENIETVINKKGGPEKVFNAVMSGTKEGATVLRSIMKSLKPDERKMVSAAVVRRMGKATPGQQDVTGEAFSINTFLTNWARLSPEARGVLFGRFGDRFKKDMDSLAGLASNIRSGSEVFRNPSGTQQAISLQAITGATAAALAFGQIDMALAALSGVAAANLSARLMTNPRFVNWLAKQTQVPAGAYSAQVQNLARMAKDDRDIALAVGLLQQGETQETQNSQGAEN